MSNRYKPFELNGGLFTGCSCGAHVSESEHQESLTTEKLNNDFIEATLVKALFPNENVRRSFIKAVGMGTAMSAISSVLPIGAMQAMAQDKTGSLEKKI